MGAAAVTTPGIERFGVPGGTLPGAGLPWLRTMREEAGARFGALGLPTPRVEAWKYTNLRPLEKVAFQPSRPESVSIDSLPSLFPHGAHRLVFVNGWLRPELSNLGALPDGVELGGLAAGLESDPDRVGEHLGHLSNGADQPMLALNTAMMGDGVLLRVSAGVTVSEPIEVIYVGAAPAEPLVYHPRNLLVLEPGSRANVVEHHADLGDGVTFANGATEVFVGEGASLHHYKVQSENTETFHVSTVHAVVERDGVYDRFILTKGARLSRNDISVSLRGPGAECHLNGVYMLRGRQHCDNTTVIEHAAPHTTCREVFKGVIDDRARGVFQGRIVVHPEAQKADGHQLSKVLLLSDRAEMDAKPELEIYADDVKCSHGAATGDLDHDALFYLRARGIPEAIARHMLIEAFLSESINNLAANGLCPALMASVGHWLSDATDHHRARS